MYLKDVTDFYGFDATLKQAMHDQAKRLKRGASGVAQGQSANLLDAAFYVKRAWDDISQTTIMNCFAKANLGLSLAIEQDNENVEIHNLVEMLRNLSIPIESSEIEEFIDADEESSPQFSEVLQEEIEYALNELVDGTPTDSIAIDELISDEEQPEEIFVGYENLILQASQMEQQLASSTARLNAPVVYDQLRTVHENFLKLLRNANLEENQQNLLL